jgi:hypothetical protein
VVFLNDSPICLGTRIVVVVVVVVVVFKAVVVVFVVGSVVVPPGIIGTILALHFKDSRDIHSCSDKALKAGCRQLLSDATDSPAAVSLPM